MTTVTTTSTIARNASDTLIVTAGVIVIPSAAPHNTDDVEKTIHVT